MDLEAPVPPRAVALLLTCGPLLFWIGAVTPPYRQWMGVPLDEYLRIVAANPRAWRFMHGCFAVGSVLTACGIGALANASSSRSWSASAASTLFALAVALWLVVVAHRVSVTPLAAGELARHGVVPRAYEASHALASTLFGAHAAMSYLAIAAVGLSLRGSALPGGVPVFAIAFGLIAIPGLATPLFQAPLTIHVVPFVIGIAICSTTLPRSAP
jgi:hypothetical protein